MNQNLSDIRFLKKKESGWNGKEKKQTDSKRENLEVEKSLHLIENEGKSLNSENNLEWELGSAPY